MPRKRKPDAPAPDIDRWTIDDQFAKALTRTAVLIIQAIDAARAGRLSESAAAQRIKDAKKPLFQHMDDVANHMLDNVIYPVLDPDAQKKVAKALTDYEESQTTP
jgi:hypothetical protein